MIDIDADADAVGNGCVGWSIFHMRIMSLASKNHRRIFQRIKSLYKQSQFHKRIQKKEKNFFNSSWLKSIAKTFFPPLISLYYSGLNRLFRTVYGSVLLLISLLLRSILFSLLYCPFDSDSHWTTQIWKLSLILIKWALNKRQFYWNCTQKSINCTFSCQNTFSVKLSQPQTGAWSQSRRRNRDPQSAKRKWNDLSLFNLRWQKEKNSKSE